ncbi:helix-turn-helix transcriptional regulator [Streptomyces lonarensis]|uniref:AAA family ATPase n=1 Tax=Streptomyces lonarensis TaxID=700599 RepID=A0A7X6D0G6_9ACTN|nr:LuxR family transcriptional regulator [Streptomyces lonarensis]NJQ05928.1 AAA family ATPase [Streptomyces lonarensis]
MPIIAPRVVGRDPEIAVITSALETARDGRGGTVFLTGESGTGKSRLVAEATGSALGSGMRVLRGRTSTIGPMVPFRPLTEALMPLFRGAEPLDDSRFGPYRPVLGRLIPDWAADAQGPTSLVALGEAVLRLLAQIGHDHGTVLILEDLHAADTETLAVVEYLVDNLEQLPVLLLITCRDDPGGTLDLAHSAARRQTGALLHLASLDRDATATMTADCLGTTPDAVPAEALDRLWEASGGSPLLVEELLQSMVGSGALVRTGGTWQVVHDLRHAFAELLARGIGHRVERLGPQGHALLSAAAVLGRRFPLSVLQRMTGLDDRTLLSHLHAAVTAQIVVADDPNPDWYAFRHPLTVTTLLAQLTPASRAALATSAADAAHGLHPDLEGEWCTTVAALRADGGRPGEAGRLFAVAGDRALRDGAVGSAVALLTRAERLLATAGEPAARAGVLEQLLPALAESGEFTQALALADSLRELVGAGLSAPRLAALRIRLAKVAHAIGRWEDGNTQIEQARSLLATEPDEAVGAAADVAAAHLVLDTPGPDRTERAIALASSAVDVARRRDLPTVACEAWELLGTLTRERAPEQALEYLELSLHTAQRNRLPLHRMYAMVRIGGHRWLGEGTTGALTEARDEAQRLGAVPLVHTIEGILVLDDVLRGATDGAARRAEECLAVAQRLRLAPVVRYLLVIQATLGAHRGDRAAMERALTSFERWDSAGSQEEPLAHGLARAFCALLEEDRPRAVDELRTAHRLSSQNATTFQLVGDHGLGLLLDALDGTADRDRYEEVAAGSPSRVPWNRHFVVLADAVLLGREGRGGEAEQRVAEARRIAADYPLALHLGIRLVGEEAHGAGWGAPARWLREAQQHFHAAGVPAVASACRGLLRQMGLTIPQHRGGSELIPGPLRSLGVTVREYEVFRLLPDRPGNKEIAGRLYISPRTVEKHIASLVAKTGEPNRAALCALSDRLGAGARGPVAEPPDPAPR